MPKCDTCKEWLLESELTRHKCPPRFECVDLDELEDFEDNGHADDDPIEWTTVYGRDPVEVAERFAYRRLEEAGEIRVRVRNPHGVTIDLRVTGEYELRFNASADGHFSDPTRWERDKLANSWDFHKRTEPVAETVTAVV